MRALMSCLLENLYHPHGVVGPALSAVIGKACHAELDDACPLLIHGVHAGPVILTVSHQRISTQRNSTGEDMAAVVIRMLANEVHPARREESPGLHLAKLLLKNLHHLCQNILCHISQLPIINVNVFIYFLKYSASLSPSTCAVFPLVVYKFTTDFLPCQRFFVNVFLQSSSIIYTENP